MIRVVFGIILIIGGFFARGPGLFAMLVGVGLLIWGGRSRGSKGGRTGNDESKMTPTCQNCGELYQVYMYQGEQPEFPNPLLWECMKCKHVFPNPRG